ncbi:MAG: fumarylacetoacetate hydrolase family protein [Candidatus Ranarchaeia archaeon]|jgi:2-keto-4-pentenoate hydratase/2-oxohepta-3-ene-1,7-dioic acid hydratase in catechol pathway
MKLGRCSLDDNTYHCLVKQNTVSILPRLSNSRLFAIPTFDELIPYTTEDIALDQVDLLAPVQPPKVVCVGKNYQDHIDEFGGPTPKNPILFLKPHTSVIGPNKAIIYPRTTKQVDYEGELGIVIRKKVRGYSPEELSSDPFVFGFTCVNDVTARDLQKADGQWTRAKSFDTFAPIGPLIEYGLNPNNLEIKTRVNGAQRQNSNTENMLFPPFHLVSFISRIMTLEPGDVIASGTPSGVGPLKVGDVVEIEVPEIGVLRNTVESQ